MEPRQPYPTDLTDHEWALIEPYVPTAKGGGRPEHYPKREILNGIFYIVRGGCAWRLLPHDFPPWQIVYHYFAQCIGVCRRVKSSKHLTNSPVLALLASAGSKAAHPIIAAGAKALR